ncbi:MAG: glycosyltransferase family 4 protein [Pseudotabrizicola sp.]|uniref:glycosyltransferase family 4 protein n=1 Tax=Pseudotabrizicola sp. TaxID=2939647 RepID=UPI0027196AAF|nr:glycosyltransferase family 4 protein [Pseudotabrizicola sp.]MDO9637332.1 glycosyltransferase family 4 protein [Pseudotabrizicola sp.]
MTTAEPPVCQGFFDAAYYQSQLAAPVPDPLAHFRAQGDRMGLDPSPYFSTRHYKALYPDWRAAGAQTALDDFLIFETQGQWHSPHPLFDFATYLRRNPDVAAARVSPAGHFARHGDSEGRSPSDGFDATYYRRRYLRLTDTCAFAHYIAHGQAAGHQPRPQSRSAAQSAAAAAQAIAGLPRPVLLGVHDAQEAGTPLLVRDMARELRARGHSPVFVLRDGGPLVAELERLGPVFVLADGWDGAGLLSGVGPDIPIFVHSAEAAGIARAAAHSGLPVMLLIHEMRGYLDARGLLPELIAAHRAGARLVASFPRMAAALRSDLGPLPVIQPGAALPPATLSAFRHWRQTGQGRALFVGAGQADARKGFDLFLDAAQAIHAERRDAIFVWLGAMTAWAQPLADQARRQGLRLLLPGFIADSLACYAAASAYLLTSREDPGPMTLIHAAATGTPFVGYAADIGLRGVADPLGQFVADGDRTAFVTAALGYARSETPATRRARRALLRPHLGMARYCDALLSLFP